MEINEKLAYCYWEYIAVMKTVERLKNKKIVPDDDYIIRDTVLDIKEQLGLNESLEQLMDKNYQDRIAKAYGSNMETSPIPVFKAMTKAKAAANVDPKYKSFTEIVSKRGLDITPSYALQSWLRSRNTIEFLSLWEQEYNPNFLAEEAKALIADTETKSSALTLKQWIPRTNAKGIVALQGRYGGTYAHPIIALDFEAWLSPRKKMDLFRILSEHNKDRSTLVHAVDDYLHRAEHDRSRLPTL